jgi:hypothetical protein
MAPLGILMKGKVKRNSRNCAALLALAFTAGFCFPAEGIILYRTDDPTANTTAPTNDATGSGWNYVGVWGDFLGTPIASHFFLSAAHIGQAGSNFVYQGVAYTLVTNFQDPFSDLNVWQVNETFPSYAPLYTRNDEKGQRLVAIGRGTQRGGPYFVGGQLRGWTWGTGDGVQRWGENVVADIIAITPTLNDFVYATFDQDGLADECHFSAGDSGGAVFISDGGVWKLAGINYGVDGPYYTDAMGNGEVLAALFDVEDLYSDPPNYVHITQPTPTGFYATRVSSKVAWIESVIDPTGISNIDGNPNLLEYAKALNGPIPQGYGAPDFDKTPTSVSLTYRRIAGNASLQYEVQQSTNLTSWGSANAQDSIGSTNGNIQTVTSTVAVDAKSVSLFLRLQVTQN